MSGPAELAIAAGVLVDSGLKATALLGVGWAAAALLRRGSAAQRHAVWACTLGALPLLPVFAWQRGPELALDAPWVVAVWAVGAALAAMPVVRGLIALAALRGSARRDPSAPGLLHSEHLTTPITWGLVRPVIVWPVAADTWSASHRAAALAHEQAHVARRDWAVHLVAWGVSALFWFHPLVWVARRALAREAEHAADDAVLAQGFAASDYASLLVSLAGTPTPASALGVGSSCVGGRVRAVLEPRSRSSRRWPAWALATALGLVGLPALGQWPTWSTPPEELTCSPGPNP